MQCAPAAAAAPSSPGCFRHSRHQIGAWCFIPAHRAAFIHLWAAVNLRSLAHPAEASHRGCGAKPWVYAAETTSNAICARRFSKRYQRELLFKHTINLSKMLFLLRQVENNHKLREATREIAQVDGTLIFHRPQPLLRQQPRAALELKIHGRASQGHASV